MLPQKEPARAAATGVVLSSDTLADEALIHIDILNVAAGTVMSRISRGRRLLYQHLMARQRDLPELRIVGGAADG